MSTSGRMDLGVGSDVMARRERRRAGLALVPILGLALSLMACTAAEESAFGPAPLRVVVGVTTMDEVLAHIGPPENKVTEAGGLEVWTYQRTAKQALDEPDFMRAYNAGRPQTPLDGGTTQGLVLILKFQPSGVLDSIVARQSSF